MSVDLLDIDEVRHRRDHAPDLGAVLTYDLVADALETERTQGLSLVLVASADRTHLAYLDRCHQEDTSARAFSNAPGATSSIGRPRRAATDSGDSSDRSASTVACTMLIALADPSDLVSTSCTPADSNTARTGPPAITPVPGAAGRSSTTPAAFSP